jgi:hypothetical protein
MSYFLLAMGFTISVFSLTHSLSVIRSSIARIVAKPFTAAGKYALPLYFAHYLLIFASEATGIASQVRDMSSVLTPHIVILILTSVVVGFLAIALVSDHFHFSFPTFKIAPSAAVRLSAAGIMSAVLVAYLVVAPGIYSLVGIDSENPLAFLFVGITIPVLWFVAYKALA